MLPRLTLSSSLGSGYSGNNKEFRGLEFVPKSFEMQLDENFYQSATLTLNIPIFNRGTIRSNAELARIEMLKMKVKKERTIVELEYKIEQLQIEINNASVQLNVSKTALNTAKKSFENTTLKYEEGFIHFANYTEAKKKLFQAQSEFIQAEFQYLFKQKLLSYYF